MSPLAVLHFIFSAGLLILACSHDGSQDDLFQKFSDYIQTFNKSYQVGTKEFKKREFIFKETLHRVEYLNKYRLYPQSAVYGLNQFSDLTPEEFKKLVHLEKEKVNSSSKKPSYSKLFKKENVLDGLPKKVDWREKNVVSSVNDQKQCGACWAFSTVETIESMYAMKTGNLKQWSIQQILDCASKPNSGCEGGDTCVALEWMYQNKTKIVLAKDYPFTGQTGSCKPNVKSEQTVQIASNFTCDSFVDAEHLMLLHLGYHGPLISAVDATGWQDYLGGIIQFHCDGERNHAVQIVGYDLTGDVPFYIVRNSWGPKFGNDGYLYIAIGKNVCRIAEEVSSVDVI